MFRYKNKKVAVLGLSIEGVDVVRFFSKTGAFITCCDRRNSMQLGNILNQLKKYKVVFRLGPDYLANLDKYDYVIRTPGMSLSLPEISNRIKKHKEISSLTKLFFKHYKNIIIGVTGTKGKGTTSTLIARMIEKAGRHVWLGGNIGDPLLSSIDSMKKRDIVVLELSSFQLEDLQQSPQIAVVLKITQDHLANFDKLASNYHKSRTSYVTAKKSIVKYQKKHDIGIFNKDDPTSVAFAKESKGKHLFFSSIRKDTDSYVDNNAVWLNTGGIKEQICTLKEIHLLGLHNLENIAAASLAAYSIGVNIQSIKEAVLEFEGLEHRLEYVANLSDISFYNDSYSTVPETTIAAVRSFYKPITLIAGGSEKKSDFSELGKELSKSKVNNLILIGDMAERLENAVKAAKYKGSVYKGCRTMHDVVFLAKKITKPGGIVLLSPACASFDMFENYKDRGKQFKYEISILK